MGDIRMVTTPATLLEWIEFLERNQDSKGLRAFMAYTFDVMAEGETLLLDAIFQHAEPSRLGILISTGMLRSTWRIAKHLPSWGLFRDRTKDWLISTGEDWEHIMRGMFNSKPHEDTYGLDYLLHTHPSLK